MHVCRFLAFLGGVLPCLALAQTSSASLSSFLKHQADRDALFSNYTVQLDYKSRLKWPPIEGLKVKKIGGPSFKKGWLDDKGKLEGETSPRGWRIRIGMGSVSPRESGIEITGSPGSPEVHGSMAVFFKEPSSPLRSFQNIAGPHPVLGLGVSVLTEAKAAQRGGEITITGGGPTGQEYVYCYRSIQSSAPYRLVMQAKSQSTVFDYSDVTEGQASWPRLTQYKRSFSNGSVYEEGSYSIASVTLGTSTYEGSAPKWFRPGITVEDQRLERPLTWSYKELLGYNGGSADLSSEKLLELGKRRLKGEIVTSLDRMLMPSPKASPLGSAAIVCAAGAVVCGAVWLVMKRAKAGRPA